MVEIGYAISIMLFVLLQSCTPVADIDADRSRTVIDSITIDSIHRQNLVFTPHTIAFETEYPSQEIIKSIDITNISDSLFIPINTVSLAQGNNGFSLVSNTMSFVLPPKGQTGSTKSFSIVFMPKSEGIFYDTIRINGWKNVFIPLKAFVKTGTRVWIDDINFGDVLFGESHDTIVKVFNYGTEPAIVNSAQFTGGDAQQFEVLSSYRFPITIKSGEFSTIRVRLLSNQYANNVNAQLAANISYAGQGRVKNISTCTASMAFMSKVYVSDIRSLETYAGRPYETVCSIVNFTNQACYIGPFSNIADNAMCTVVIDGSNTGYWLNPKTIMTYTMKITAKKSGPYSISIPFPISKANDPDSIAIIQGIAK